MFGKLTILLIVAVLVSLFFIRFNRPDANNVEEMAKADKVGQGEKRQKQSSESDQNQQGGDRSDQSPDQEDTDGTANSVGSEAENASDGTVGFQSNQPGRQVFITYDHEANAQALAEFLVKKEVSFPVAVKSDGGRYEVYFNFAHEEEKEARLAELAKVTGMKLTDGGQ